MLYPEEFGAPRLLSQSNKYLYSIFSLRETEW